LLFPRTLPQFQELVPILRTYFLIHIKEVHLGCAGAVPWKGSSFVTTFSIVPSWRIGHWFSIVYPWKDALLFVHGKVRYVCP
jgi:hypothetical protein